MTHQLFESETPPDVIVNVVDGSNLERNLYMTIQLMEAGVPTVVALNMYDELRESGTRLDLKALSGRVGMAGMPNNGSPRRKRRNAPGAERPPICPAGAG